VTQWKVVASSVPGTSHREQNIPCQDAYQWSVENNILIAVVSDGAGSASKSDIGSQVVSNTITEHMQGFCSDQNKMSDSDFLKQEITNAIEKARKLLLAENNEALLEDYYATIVGCICTPTVGLFFQIGDGLGAAVYNNDWQNCIMSLPENGEFSDQTYFYTQDNWQEHLRFSAFDPEVQYLILMSDGAMSFAAAKQLKGLESKFMVPVSHYLEQNDQQQGNTALESTLDSPKTYSITGDDKTLLWVARVL